MEGSPALEHLEQHALWAAFHIARLEEVITSQQRALDTLDNRLRRLEHEALEAVSDLYFRLDSISAIVNQLILRARALQLQIDFLGGLPENTDSVEFSFYSLN